MSPTARFAPLAELKLHGDLLVLAEPSWHAGWTGSAPLGDEFEVHYWGQYLGRLPKSFHLQGKVGHQHRFEPSLADAVRFIVQLREAADRAVGPTSFYPPALEPAFRAAVEALKAPSDPAGGKALAKCRTAIKRTWAFTARDGRYLQVQTGASSRLAHAYAGIEAARDRMAFADPSGRAAFWESDVRSTLPILAAPSGDEALILGPYPFARKHAAEPADWIRAATPKETAVADLALEDGILLLAAGKLGAADFKNLSGDVRRAAARPAPAALEPAGARGGRAFLLRVRPGRWKLSTGSKCTHDWVLTWCRLRRIRN